MHKLPNTALKPKKIFEPKFKGSQCLLNLWIFPILILFLFIAGVSPQAKKRNDLAWL